jgi:hypothetical protein
MAAMHSSECSALRARVKVDVESEFAEERAQLQARHYREFAEAVEGLGDGMDDIVAKACSICY